MNERNNDSERLKRRWYHSGERQDLRHEAVAVIRAIQHGEKDWESYLKDLPYVNEVENGRDLRGLDISGMKGIQGLRYARDGFIDLNGADLHKADLSHTNLYRIHLEDANLYSANLSYANLKNTHLSGSILEYVNVRGANIDKVDLRDFNLTSLNGLSEAYLSDIRLGDTLISKEQFKHNGNKYFIKNEDIACKCILSHNLKDEIDDAIRHFETARGVYLALKNNFISIGEHKSASWSAYKEKQMEKHLLALKLQKGDYKGLFALQKRMELIGYNVFDMLCQYGENPFRLAWWGIVVVVIWALLYPIFGIENSPSGTVISYSLAENSNEIFHAFLKALYLSTVTFTTVGYGDLVPSGGLSHYLAGIEGFFGLLFLGLFVWTLGRSISAR